MTPPTVSDARRSSGPGFAGCLAACYATRPGLLGGVPARKINREEMDKIKAEIRGMSEALG